ncbi:MAG: transglutaminase-like domain-containing protein [Bacteroidales bacterium]|nr:transglutaminase-like domain-containing protein [Bacteroidales bacterium]
MVRLIVFSSLLSLLLSASCTNNHLIRDKAYRQQVARDFELRKELASKRQKELFSPFNENLTSREKEALQFLFAYMPLSDLADYNGDFFLANTRYALAALEEAEWNDSIPDHIFLHYVLPPRVNNENLDSFRIAYYTEIRQRISGMPLIKAALEINHWCQEKVSYQPADIRTSAPMSTVLSARGRCGEESTFTVAALRTAGIPARQVYTPRWAHTDDNHAWVEIWHNGDWFYMGACEPEPLVDSQNSYCSCH